MTMAIRKTWFLCVGSIIIQLKNDIKEIKRKLFTHKNVTNMLQCNDAHNAIRFDFISYRTIFGFDFFLFLQKKRKIKKKYV